MEEKKKKIGIVLEGGATRGMYTAGVLDTFLKENIEADILVGVSAGALFGVNYVSRQYGRAIRYNKRFNQDKNYMGIIPLLKEGNIVNTKYAYEDVPLRLDPFDIETFNSSDKQFYAVVTDIDSGTAEYILLKDIFKQMDILRASGSMPFVSKPVEVNGKRYLDGAIKDSIPYRWMAEQGVDKIIVVLTQDASYRKKAMPKLLTDVYSRIYPHVARGMAERHLVYNSQVKELGEWENEGKAFVIRPSEPIRMGKLERDPSVLQKVYDLGVKDCCERLEELRNYLNK